MENFVRMTEVLTPSGVYALLRQGEVIYVGKSLNVFARLSKHFTNMRRVQEGKPAYSRNDGPVILFDDCWVQWAHYDKIDRLETQLIQKWNPICNQRLNRPKVDISHLPAFAEMLARATRSRGPVIMRRPVHPFTETRRVSVDARRGGRRMVRVG